MKSTARRRSATLAAWVRVPLLMGLAAIAPLRDAAAQRPEVDLAVTITDGVETANPGDRLTYVIEVVNNGPAFVSGAVVTDVFPPKLTETAWTCSATDPPDPNAADPPSSCAPGRAGDINDVVEIRNGGRLTYRATATVVANAREAVVNFAEVAAPEFFFDPNPSNNRAAEVTVLSPFQVNSREDGFDSFRGDGNCDTGRPTPDGQPECSLRAAIEEANSFPDRNAVNVPAGLYPLTALVEGPVGLEVRSDLDLIGAGAAETTLDGGGNTAVISVFRGATVSITGFTIANGAGCIGGGVSNDGDLTLTDTVVRDNEACAGSGIVNFGRLLLRDGVLSGNQGGGGALFNGEGAFARLINATVGGNFDSAIVNQAGELSLVHCTLARNEGAGIINLSGPVTLLNTLTALNPAGDCLGPVESRGGNLDSDGSCALEAGPDLPGVTDPGLGELRDNDGPTPTFALLPASPAIDRAACSPTVALDQRGAGRPTDGDGNGSASCDVGSYEAPPFQSGSIALQSPAARDLDDQRSAYRMIGSPLGGVPKPGRFLVDSIGPPNSSRWRLFRYDGSDGDYRELSSNDLQDPAFDFLPGRAFWLIALDGLDVSLAGVANDASGRPFDIPLEPVAGWQQVGSPFNFPLDWGCVADRLPEGAVPALCAFEPEGGNDAHVFGGVARPEYQFADRMRPTAGYWFFLSQSQLEQQGATPSLSIPPICAQIDPAPPIAAKALRPRPQTPTAPGDWRLRLSVTAAGFRDGDNYLGLDESGNDGFDPLDYPEPPLLAPLSLYFPHREWNAAWPRFASDIRSAAGAPPSRLQTKPLVPASVWRFEIRADLVNRPVELRWAFEGRPGVELILLDLDGRRTINMGRTKAYRYNSGSGGLRRFQVMER